MDELNTAMNDHLDQIQEIVEKIPSEIRIGMQPAMDNFIGFFHAIDWKVEISMAGVYFAEQLNTVLRENWKSFAGQNYFDRNGVFLSVLWSGPLLVFATIILELEHHNKIKQRARVFLYYLVKHFGPKCRCYNANTICLLCLNARNAWSALSAINFESYKLIMQKQRFGLSVLASQVAKLKSYKLVMQKQRFGLSVLASPVAKLKSYELDKLKQRFGLSVLASPVVKHWML
ncbi:hypothetical protein E3N88_32991 [Mikania micrantha]|uniref:Uncharacterized protein n=1 Tax=Mikania micrantha TaxID=192012 RepID=A0A5N6MB95_9ASTR|nr:hypothetical protein E3N88_32991 [Mikania micrantha]